MSDTEDPIPRAVARKPGPRSLQMVWVIPILAAIIGASIAFKSFWDSGPTIRIQFLSGEGIEAGKTRIKHKAVDVGIVRSVKLSPDRKSVVVTAEIDRSAADGFLVEDTRFWVVRPRISGGQVSGLSTLLGGSYIGSDPGNSYSEKRDFVGLETPPTITSDLPGREFKLAAEDLGSLDTGSPVYYRGVVAGRVTSTEISSDGRTVLVGAFVSAPFDKFVNDETRFWNASGVDLSIDATGVRLQSQSLLTLVLGGVAFESPTSARSAPQAAARSTFRLWANRSDAMRERENVVETYVLRFEQSTRGLSVGAPVDFRGVMVGEVRNIELRLDMEKVRYWTAVEIHLWPERLKPANKDASERWESRTPQERIARFVEHGFRAQLRGANLITGQQYVALDFFPKEPKRTLDVKRSPPEIPTIPGSLAGLEESLGNVMKNLEKVPFDQLAKDLRKTLAGLDAALKRADTLMEQLSVQVAPELRATLKQARKTLNSAQQVLQSDSPVQGDLRDTLQEVNKAASQVRALADYLERHPESLIRGKRPAGDAK